MPAPIARSLPRSELEQLYQSYSTPQQLNSDVGVARGESPGRASSLLRGRPIGEISQIDRYTDTRRMDPVTGALYGGVLAPAWEAYKGAAQAGVPGVKQLSDALGGDKVPPELQQFSATKGKGATSPASLSNVTAPIKGTIASTQETFEGLKSYAATAWQKLGEPSPKPEQVDYLAGIMGYLSGGQAGMAQAAGTAAAGGGT
jgi:hypothetical protein